MYLTLKIAILLLRSTKLYIRCRFAIELQPPTIYLYFLALKAYLVLIENKYN